MLKVGAQAPEFTVAAHTGETIRLSDLRGSRVLLWFYPKADTPGWTIEGCEFRDKSADYTAKNVKIFGVSFDTVEENRAFAEKFDFNFPLLCDTDRAMGIAYGACSGPGDGYARRISVLISADATIGHVVDNVDAKTHPSTLLEEL